MVLQKKAERERERERERKPLGEAKPSNLLIIALFGLAPFACIFALFSLHFGSCVYIPSMYMQQTKKTQNQQTIKRDRKETKKELRKQIRQESKGKEYKRANKHVIKQTNKKGRPQRTNLGLDLVSVDPLY